MLKIVKHINNIRYRLPDEDLAAAREAARQACIANCESRVQSAQVKIDAAQAKIDAYTAKQAELESKRQTASNLANVSYLAFAQVSNCVPGMGIDNQNALVDNLECMTNYMSAMDGAIQACETNITNYTAQKEAAEREKANAEAAKGSC